MTRTNTPSSIAIVSDLLQVISPEPRLEILLAIGAGEACVCHLEARLNQRQAYISQHLMALREAGIITARRDSRFIFYRLANLELLTLIQQAARLTGLPADALTAAAQGIEDNCNCPKCAPVGVASIP